MLFYPKKYASLGLKEEKKIESNKNNNKKGVAILCDKQVGDRYIVV